MSTKGVAALHHDCRHYDGGLPNLLLSSLILMGYVGQGQSRGGCLQYSLHLSNALKSLCQKHFQQLPHLILAHYLLN